MSGQAAPTESQAAATIASLTDWMVGIMTWHGIRGGQIALARNGRLVFAKAVTLAEAGYPVLRNDHLLRIGSLSKPLTAMAVVDHYGTMEALNSSLVDELGLSVAPINVPMQLIRIQDILSAPKWLGWVHTPEIQIQPPYDILISRSTRMKSRGEPAQ